MSKISILTPAVTVARCCVGPDGTKHGGNDFCCPAAVGAGGITPPLPPVPAFLETHHVEGGVAELVGLYQIVHATGRRGVAPS